ncbi:unnamed protein product [Coregonus sp. 'balchen']|nr:unnamed protein product [Coregonus sp. 'balchen']
MIGSDLVQCGPSVDVNIKEEHTFSKEEEQKLQSALSLDKQSGAGDCCLHSRTGVVPRLVFSYSQEKSTLRPIADPLSTPLQAVYHNVKPASLKQQFENIHLTPEKAAAFCQAWTTACPDVVEKVRQRIFAPKNVQKTS